MWLCVCVQRARGTWWVVEELAPESFTLRSVMAPPCPSPHSHVTSRKYTTSPTCQILPAIRALGCDDSEYVCGRGPPPLLDWGTPQAASTSLLLTVGVPLLRLTAPEGLLLQAPSPFGREIQLTLTRVPLVWGMVLATVTHHFSSEPCQQGVLNIECGSQSQMVLSPPLTVGMSYNLSEPPFSHQ